MRKNGNLSPALSLKKPISSTGRPKSFTAPQSRYATLRNSLSELLHPLKRTCLVPSNLYQTLSNGKRSDTRFLLLFTPTTLLASSKRVHPKLCVTPVRLLPCTSAAPGGLSQFSSPTGSDHTPVREYSTPERFNSSGAGKYPVNTGSCSSQRYCLWSAALKAGRPGKGQ